MTQDNDTEFRYPFEERCAEVLRELRDTAEIAVRRAQFGEIPYGFDDAGPVFEDLAEDDDLPFGPRIRERYFRHGSIEAYWRSSRPGSRLVGEFRLAHLLTTVLDQRMDVIWKGEDDTERALYRELRYFDDTPRTGAGRMALLRATPGATDPEIWFFDTRQGVMPMELDYAGYLDALLITKGVMGWQYLYCEPAFSGLGFASSAGGLKEMAEDFPRLFPDHDYTDLRARLEERL
ncbi:hypothetical protein [Streptomyces bicolor]|uniref:hypothetical protein n=1 Tax=Streptomyces bicolor TaxID=66874 RepID=UPI00068A70CC|nr:hypothetical protein [Streptomyces bicolor]